MYDKDSSPSGHNFSQGDSAEHRHIGELFLIPWMSYPYTTWILMMDSYSDVFISVSSIIPTTTTTTTTAATTTPPVCTNVTTTTDPSMTYSEFSFSLVHLPLSLSLYIYLSTLCPSSFLSHSISLYIPFSISLYPPFVYLHVSYSISIYLHLSLYIFPSLSFSLSLYIFISCSWESRA